MSVSRLLEFCVVGDLPGVLGLLQEGVDCEGGCDPQEPSPPGLRELYSIGGMEGIEACGISLGRTPLAQACYYGHLAVVEALLEVPCRLEPRDFLGLTPLHLAGERGHEDVIGYLLRKGAGQQTEKLSPLVCALAQGHERCAHILLDAGLKPRGKVDGKNALQWAVFQADPDLVRRLLAFHKKTPDLLWLAVSACRFQAEDPLTYRGTAVKVFDSQGMKVLMPYPESLVLQVVEILLQAGVPITEPRLLEEAKRWGHVQVATRLTQAFARATQSTVSTK